MDGGGAAPAGREPCILVLDIGTSSVRSALFDTTGAALGRVPVLQLPCAWRTPPGGGMETDPDALLGQVVEAVDAAVAAARAARCEILGVATAAFWHSLMGVGHDAAASTPLYGWGDTRAAAAAAQLRARLDAAEIHRRTGCFLDASYPAARLLWLREAQPDIFRRTAYWISFGEFLGLRLFGELRCSLSLASGTGLLDGWRLGWDEEMLDAVGVRPTALAPLVDADEPFCGLRPEFAARWPELARLPWLPPLGDGACANLGSGAVGRAAHGLTLGTSAALRALLRSAEPVVMPALWCYRLDARRVVVGRALSNGGNAIATLERWLRLPPPAAREAALAAMPPDAHGLTVLPTLVGERGPDPAAAGPGAAVAGLRAATAPLELLRAWMEAIALRIGEIAAALEVACGAPERVLAGGGALRGSPAWRQIVADVLGRPVHLVAPRETAARGAALLALERLGRLEDALTQPPPAAEEIRPEPARHQRYRSAAERQQALAAALARGVHPLERT